MSQKPEQLRQLLQVSKDGIITLNNERVILWPVSYFGNLRKDLVRNIGIKRTRGFLLRFGWDLGINAAKQIESLNIPIEDAIYAGSVLHTMTGHVYVEPTFINVDLDTDGSVKSVHMEGIWHNSYEAEEYIKQFGFSDTPICHTLAGYGGGYMTTICKHPTVFKEIACRAMGDSTCRWVAKSLHLWGEEEEDYHFFDEKPIIEELNDTYEKLLEERNNLLTVTNIHNKLTDEMIKGSDLDTILRIVYETLKVPILINDNSFRRLYSYGLSERQLDEIHFSLQTYLSSHAKGDKRKTFYFPKTTLLEIATHNRLITPIYLQNQVFGYASFIFAKNAQLSTILPMTLERVASVCSLYFLNEKIRFEATERMKGHFFEEIIYGRYTSKKEILQKGQFINLDLNQPFYIMALQYVAAVKDHHDEFNLYERLFSSIHDFFKEHGLNILSTQRMDKFIFLLQASLIEGWTLESICQQIIRLLKKQNPQYTFHIGVSRLKDDVTLCRDAYDEALAALRFVNSSKPIVAFDHLGLVGALINENNQSFIKRLAMETLKPVLNPQLDSKLELLPTLYTFLKHGCNLEQTARELSISISGLRYRIQKLEELLNRNLRDPETSFNLYLLLRSLILIGEIKI